MEKGRATTTHCFFIMVEKVVHIHGGSTYFTSAFGHGAIRREKDETNGDRGTKKTQPIPSRSSSHRSSRPALNPSSSREAFWLDDRTVGYVAEDEECNTAGLYSISVHSTNESLALTSDPPPGALLGKFPTASVTACGMVQLQSRLIEATYLFD